MTTQRNSPARLGRYLRYALTLAFFWVFAADGWSQVSETFNANGTFAVPPGVTQVTVECWGGGGRGGQRSSNGRGGGGGGGAYSRSVLTVTPSTNHTVTVGDGSNSTGDGGESWFSTAATIMAKGGASCGNNSTTGAAGGSAATSIGTVKYSGGSGANAPGGTGAGGGSSAGSAANGANGSGINGGTAPIDGGDGGDGGDGFVANGNGGVSPGGGGGGAERGCCTTMTGGSGAKGRVIVTYIPCPVPVIVSTTSNSPFCAGSNLTLGVTATGATSYSWSGTGTFSPNSTSASVSVAGATAGTYTVTATNSCGSVNDDVVVAVNSGPQGVTASSSSSSVCSTANTVNLTSTASALPSTVLSQNFNSGISPWTTTNTSTGGTTANAAWTARANNYNYSGTVFSSNDASQFVLSNSDAQGSGSTTATTIVSPVFSTEGYSALSLSYYHYYRYNAGTDDRARVEVSANGGAWTIVQTHSSIQGARNNFVQATVDLSSYVNESSLQVRFRYNASWDYYWALDNVVLTGTPAPLTYAWTSVPSGFTSGLQNPTGVAVTASTVYTVTVTGSNGCTTSANTSVTYTTAPSATISYAASPYCAGGYAVVTRTGTAGGAYTSTAGLTINASTGQVNLGSSTPGTYTVTYAIAAAAPCAAFSTTASITINTAPFRYADTDGDGYGDPASFITNCLPVVGYVSNNTDNCPTLFGLIGDACDDGDANTINDIINGSCVCAGTNAPWYSQGSGSFTDAIWSHNIAGPGALAALNSASDVIIQSGHAVTLAGVQDVHDISVEATASLGLGANTLNVFGNSVDIDGSLLGGTGNLNLEPTGAATLDGSGTLNLFDLTVNAPNGLNCLANAPIRGTLSLVNGAFTATGAVSLVSNVNLTGRLGPVAATASYVGDLTVNRYIPAGATNWRMLGSSVSGQTVNEWKDDFYTAGFPGSHSPGFSNPVGSGILWPSIRWYNETNVGPVVIDGLTGATGTSQPLVAGQGFAAWCGTGFATTTAFNVDMSGAPNVASIPITLPLSYTNTGVPATDGWNMVSNPLPSPIAFDQISRGADVDDYITYFDPATGNNATWDISMGVGVNNGTNTVQSSQAFWLKASGSNVTTTVSESAKVAGNTGGFFGGDQQQLSNIVRLRLTSNMNQYSDETVIVFSEGSPEVNGDDVVKFVFAHPEAPQIATVGDAGQMIAINAYGEYTTDISIPVMFDVAVNGTYTITATGLGMSGLSCLRLEDLASNTSTPLVEGASYSFTALGSDNANTTRFVLHASAPLQFATTSATCAGLANGSATVEIGSGPVDIVWMDGEGVVLLEQNNVQAGTSEFSELEAGSYSMEVTSNAGCGNLMTSFVIEQPSALEVEADATPTSCPVSEDGTIDLMVLGGVAPYTYLWSNGSTESAIEVPAGIYTVEVTDANGCSVDPQEVEVGAGEGPEAGISVENTTVSVNDEVTFFVSSTNGVSNTWDFGDGATSDELEPTHSFSLPGTYTITLNVDDGTCTSTTTLELNVESTTGLATIVGHTLNAWVSGDLFVVDHNFNDNEPVLVRVLSTNGQLVQTHRFAGQPARLTLPTADLATGIWLVRVSSANSVRTVSLPVLR